ncbi:MAG TPA: hypothetical protein VL651_11245 [Bacteroidia bacterium]|jgi:hypothetical protein|nr:hypothetical protein [Bacteroidia bacterium]
MNKYQCPQCGAASSMRTSPTTYHCIYCDSSFEVQPDQQEVLNTILQQQQQQAANKQAIIDQLNALRSTTNAVAYAKPRIRIVTLLVVILVFIGGMAGFIFNKKSHSLIAAGTGGMLSGSNWSTATIRDFKVFSGTKGTVVWQLYEQSGYNLDSERYILRIIDPVKNSVTKEMAFVPTVTWDEGFNSGEFIGDFHAFGDTCWIINDRDGLIARDAYTGDVIVDKNRLGKMFPKLASGVTKASYYDGQAYFELNTNDGFEYRYSPWTNKLYTKDEWDALEDAKGNKIDRTFFNLSDDDKRPQLYISAETVSAYDLRSNLFGSNLEEYSSGGVPSYYKSSIHSVKKVNPDKVYFNGVIEYADNSRAIIAYQESNNKKSPMHICAIDASGKELWNISNNDTKPFNESFSSSNRSVDHFISGNKIVFYLPYDNNHTIELDMTSGKTDWVYSSDNTSIK